MQKVVQVQQVLLPQRFIQVVFGLQVGQHRCRNLAFGIERTPGRGMQQQIADRDDSQQGRQGRQHPAKRVRPHQGFSACARQASIGKTAWCGWQHQGLAAINA
jgi:hypothetical protein